MRKRIISIILAIALALCVGCGKSEYSTKAIIEINGQYRTVDVAKGRICSGGVFKIKTTNGDTFWVSPENCVVVKARE